MPDTSSMLTVDDIYVVEVEGHNDGHPYEVGERFSDRYSAEEFFEQRSKDYPKVRHRIIKIEKDWA